jgi:AmmeMemoRadiSam system protein B
MTQIRKPAVAGCFYPEDRAELQAMVARMLNGAATTPGPAPKALIVPHAGFVYSGAVAASAYARLSPYCERYRRVVLLGPSHRVAVPGVATSSASAFRTPLGDVPLDRPLIESLGAQGVCRSDDAHRLEHSLEVQLPFLQAVLPEFSLVPLAVGAARPESVAALLETLWNGDGTLIVISSDLSHFLGYADARRRDRVTCQAIEASEAERIGYDDACGATAVAALLIVARRRGLAIRTLDLRNSGDTAGGRDRVVGYGAWMLLEPETCERAA